MEGDQRRKISLPAAIFNRSPSRGSENSSMLSNTNNFKSNESLEHPCFNHPNKKARYRVLTEDSEDDEEVAYCEKCAILLASRGFEVQKLEEEGNKCQSSRKTGVSRSEQLENFLKELAVKAEYLRKAERQGEELFSTLQEKEDQEI